MPEKGLEISGLGNREATLTTHGPNFSRVHTTFRVLAHPYRRSMLEIAALQPSTLAQMCEFLPITPQTVCYHLKILLDSGLVVFPMGWDGSFTYRPNAARLEQLHSYIDSCLMPSWQLEQRGRIVCHFGDGELEACREALKRMDEERGHKLPVPPPKKDDAAPAPNILRLLAE